MKYRHLIPLSLLLLAAWSCEADRAVVPNTHDGRVPDIIGLTYTVDTNNVGQKVVKLRWGYDSLKYGTDRLAANLRDWEIYRSATDTSQFTSRGKTFFPQFNDASNEVQPGGRDSIVIMYRIVPNGYLVDDVQFIGKPSDILQIVIRKKK
ncbi:MAG: hypothetical protein F9K22_08325 [Bacteroidetes bacterium]|nr:MAG: hypothetical protein F9K22_08325 [Bacteroidota bacterium]